jgi:uncharacterized coiled-coil protein SlyX
MSDELISLQIKISFLENDIVKLNDVVLNQNVAIDLLKKDINILLSRIDRLSGNDNLEIRNERPPHY